MSAADAYRKNMDPTPRVRKVSGPFSQEERLKTVADALAHCEALGLDPADVRLAHNYCLWEREETLEEVAQRIRVNAEGLARHVEWVKSIHEAYVSEGLLP